MQLLNVIFLILFVFCQNAFGGDAKMEERVKKKYGENYVENMKKLNYPGTLLPGKAQDIEEQDDKGAKETKEMSDDGIKKKAPLSHEMIQQAITAQKDAMDKWGRHNRGMEYLKPLKELDNYQKDK